MREDFSKVVTEKPRYGHANRSKKTRLKVNVRHLDEGRHSHENLPSRAPVSKNRQYGYDSKDFSDRLGPLKRFLRKNIGRPWDKVYGELSQVLDKRSLTGRHIWMHIWQEVKVNCFLGPDGKVYLNTGFWSTHPFEGFYVHPRTKLLCHTK